MSVEPSHSLPSSQELADLLARIESATGPDRELDCDVFVALEVTLNTGQSPGPGASPFNPLYSPYLVLRPGNQRLTPATREDAPTYTASVDVALSLKNRLLPGHAGAVGDMAFDPPPRPPWACIWTKGGDPKFHGEGKTPALALLSAIFRALSDGVGLGPTSTLGNSGMKQS